MNVLELAQSKVQLKKVASTHGGEYQGPCPGCGGKDRFHVWSAQNEGRGSYWCRACGRAGDSIQFLRDFEGLTFQEACNRLNIATPHRTTLRTPSIRKSADFEPVDHKPPSDLWQEKAEKLVIWAHECLLQDHDAMSWLAQRGIVRDTVIQHRIGWNPGENGKDIFRARKAWDLSEIMKENGRPRVLWIPIGLVIPCISDGKICRIRIRRPEGNNPENPRYYVLPGSSMKTMLLEPGRRAFVVVESELDALLVSQYPQVGAVALGSVSAKPDVEAYKVLKDCLQILISLDFDDAGAKAMQWWSENSTNCNRWPVPAGKDPSEAFQLGVDIEQWVKAGLPPAMIIEEKENQEPEVKEHKPKSANRKPESGDWPETILELHNLLAQNPSVQIINTPERLTVLRNGKYVGGRINELVFRTQEVLDHILSHPDEMIDRNNLLNAGV